MYPILLTIGPVKIYSFGLFLSLALVLGSFVIWREGKKKRFDEEKILDLILWVSFFAIFGARFYYLLTHYSEFGFSPFKWLLIFHFPGLSFWGAFFGGFIGGLIFVLRNHWSFWQVGDFFVLGAILAEGIGRIGAFLSGTGYGIVTDLPWGFPVTGLLGKRHPVQLYEALICFIIFITLLKLKEFVEKRRLPIGFIFLTYFILLSLEKFMLEIFKEQKLYFRSWQVNQIISISIFFISLLLLYKRLGRELKENFFLVKKKLTSFKIRKKGESL